MPGLIVHKLAACHPQSYPHLLHRFTGFQQMPESVEGGSAMTVAAPQKQAERSTLQRCVDSELSKYFAMLEGHAPRGLYRMVMSQAESALIRHVLDVCNDNQSRAAAYLGISRGKLRSRIKELSLD